MSCAQRPRPADDRRPDPERPNATASATLGILRLTDASCTTSVPTATALHISVDSAPRIRTQPHDLTVPADLPTAFGVIAPATACTNSGSREGTNPPKKAGTDAPVLVTDPVRSTFQVWVVITNGCGSIESQHVTASNPATKRRAAGH